MSFFGFGGRDESERFNESESYDDNRHGEQGRFNEAETYDSHEGGGGPPPPPVSYPWRAHWHDRERRYYFVNEETNETVWDYEEVRRRTRGEGGYDEQQSTDYSDRRGDEYQNYQTNEGFEGDRRHGGYGRHEGERIHNDYEQDKYRGENFPEDTARWGGRKGGEAQDGEYGGNRFDNREEQRFDNARDDGEYAPERAGGWMGRREGEGERYDDNVDNSYEEGRYEGRDNYRENY